MFPRTTKEIHIPVYVRNNIPQNNLNLIGPNFETNHSFNLLYLCISFYQNYVENVKHMLTCSNLKNPIDKRNDDNSTSPLF